MYKQNISWINLQDYCIQLAENIKNSREQFSCIVALARGGLMPAQIISYKLGIKRVYSLGASFYDNEDFHAQPDLYQLLPKPLKEEKILIVDELIDSSRSILFTINELKQRECVDIRTASIWVKETSPYTPDFYLFKYPVDMWITFPYDI